MSDVAPPESAGAPVLRVRRHALPDADETPKAPFWEVPWCPPVLDALAFGGPQRTYALIDAGKRAELLGYTDLQDLHAAAATECLYLHAASGDLAEVAPYLVDISAFGVAPERLPHALRDLFAEQWAGEALILLRTSAGLKALKNHLRHFTRIRSSQETEGWTFFRFWSPQTAQIYFPGIANRPERADRFFRISADIPLEMIIPDGTGVLHIAPHEATGPEAEPAPIIFDTRDHALMQVVADRIFARQIEAWLREAYADRAADTDAARMEEAVRHIQSEGRRVGCTLKEDYAYLAHMMMTLGGWFVQAGHPKALTDLFDMPAAQRRTTLPKAFLPAFEQSPQALLMQNWEAVTAHLAALPDHESVTPEAFRSFIQRFLGAQEEAVGAALATTRRDLPQLGLSMTQQGRYLVLALIYGPHFHRDPLRAWPALPLGELVDQLWTHMLGDN